jgi:hypothetical protein
MNQINKLELTAKISDPGKLVKLNHNDNLAINSIVSFNFGKKKCQFQATAYNEIAEKISKLPINTEVIIEGALYQEQYLNNQSGQMQYINKIRINKIEEIQHYS